MADAGFEVINDAGTFSVSSRNPTLAFIQKGTTLLNTFVPAVGGVELAHYKGTITLPSGYDSIVVAVRTSTYLWQFLPDPVSVFRCAASGQSLTWYMFARPATPSGSGAGIQIFDENGKCTFDSNAKPGRVMGVTRVSYSGAQQFDPKTLHTGAAWPAGKTYAMVPFSYTERVYQSGINVRYFSSEFSCNANLAIRERLYTSGTTDTSDAFIGGQAGAMLIDVTGY